MPRQSVKSKVKKTLIDISLKLARKGEGCILVIMENKFDYDLLVEQDIKPFNILENQRRLERIAKEDGACIISPKGELINYAVKIKNTVPFKPYGTRHGASYTASMNGNAVFLASEEDKKVRIFENGKLIMQLDSLEKGIEQKSSQIINLWESLGVGLVSAMGVSVLSGTSAIFSQSLSSLTTAGVTFLPGVIIFGGIFTLIKYLSKQAKK